MERKMKTVKEFHLAKQEGRKISMVTCYDYWSAKILNASAVDAILVGDSLGMVVYGNESTIGVSIETMALHTAAVRKGAPEKLIVGDLPFLSFRKGLSKAIINIEKLVVAGAQAVKLEGISGNEKIIQHTVESGIPVMAHLGLTPQFVHQMGGYKVQGQTEDAAQRIFTDAKKAQDLGCFALVLEGVPAHLCARISKNLAIATIGIGAGVEADGQILVLQDLWGLTGDHVPKFVRKFVDGRAVLSAGLEAYDRSVKNKQFPSEQESYS